MAIGFYFNGNCYASQQNAIDTSFQSQATFISIDSTTTNFIFHNRDSHGAWSYQKIIVSALGQPASQYTLPVNAPTFGSCDTADFSQYDITPSNVLYSLTFGMSFLLIMWSFGYAIGAAKKIIDKI